MPNLQNQSLGESGQIVTTGDTGVVTSTMIADGTIANADISTSAAIAISKLASGTSGQIVLANATGVPTYTTVSGDVTLAANGSIQIASNTIVDAEINSAAAIALSKLASGTSAQIVLANATGVPTYTAVSGDIAITSAGVTAIASNTIVNADINTLAAIDLSKLATGTAGRIVLANATGIPTYTAVSGDVTITNAGVTSISTSANPTIAGLTANSATGKVIINTDAGGSVSIGNTAGVASTPYIDFNSGATAVDFDARIQSSGGSGVSGGGTLTITSANTIISGNLTINGTTTTVNTATLNVSDNIIILNNDVTGTPTENAGIEVERGTSPNVSIRWNETTDKWQFTTDGTNYTDLGAGGASISDTAPASPTAGQIWFESDTAQTFVYYNDGTSNQWVEIGASGAAAYVAGTAPASPITGQLWYNSSTGGTFIYYNSAWSAVSSDVMTDSKNAAILVMDIGA